MAIKGKWNACHFNNVFLQKESTADSNVVQGEISPESEMWRGESTPPESIGIVATSQATSQPTTPMATILQTPAAAAINATSKPAKPVKPAKPSSTQNLGTLISSYISSSSSGTITNFLKNKARTGPRSAAGFFIFV